MDNATIYQKVLDAQGRHVKFLNAIEKNLSYFYFGKYVQMINRDVFPQIDLLNAVSSYTPEPYNPVSYLISAFIDEIANSDFRTTVRPYPVGGKEPYESFSDILENYLVEIHRQSKRKKYIKGLAFELLAQGYFGIYTNGFKYWFLTPYDLIPGDPSITNVQDQPMMIRKTKARKSFLKTIPGLDIEKEAISELTLIPDLENVGLYDIWIKDLDLNICLTQSGQQVYSQPFPFPKVYPIFAAVDTELLNSFYPIPMMQKLSTLLQKYQDSQSSTEESSKSIAKPLLVYDADSGIDIDMVRRALKEGYKHIIIGKNREGDINFKAPGNLPGYAVQQSDKIVDEMMKHLGLTQMFLGTPMAGIRERGALTRLIKASFRKLASKAALIEEVFSDLDAYLLEYLKYHKMNAADQFGFKNVEEIFTRGTYYIPEEKFPSFSSDDTYENKMFTLSKWRAKLVSQEASLAELGHTQPKKIIEQIREEAKEQVKFSLELKTMTENAAPKSVFDQIWERLKGKLANRFFLTPVADNKVLVRCAEEDEQRVGFLLIDMSNSVLVETYKKKLPVPADQKELKVETSISEPETPPSPVPGAPEVKGVPVEPSERTLETRGRPSMKLPVSVKPLEMKVPEEKKGPASAASTAPITHSSPGFSEDYLQSLVRLTKTVKPTKEDLNLPGIYVQEPHAQWIYQGKKLLLVKAKEFNTVLNNPYLLCGKDKVYGIIIVRRIVKDFDFEALKKYHMVSNYERKRWWKNNPLYLYMFEFHPFEIPLDYEREQGVQTFIQNVKIKGKESLGLPYRGDLKPIVIAPWKVPAPHKPEKKAFQPYEVFSIQRLKEIIPEAVYDVSFKVDGLRAFLWVSGGQAKLYSDVGAQWTGSRVKPILDDAVKIFKHDVLLDGELVMKETPRKNVAGFIHGLWQPTPEQLASLRYICWDILYVKDRSIASLPFSKRSAILDLYLPYKQSQKGVLRRVSHAIARNRDAVPALAKRLMSNEGIIIRDVNASYWATHATYKMKKMFDIDAKVIAVEKTKIGLPIYHCVLRDGTYVGQTYAQSEVKAEVGDVIRVNIEHVSIKPDGSIGWFAPRPQSWKQKITPKSESLTQVGIGGADTLDLLKEVYLVTGGTEALWNEWFPKHEEWKKTKMSPMVERLKEKVKAGVPAAKT